MFAREQSIHSAGFYYCLLAFPKSKWQLPHAYCSTLSYRCEKDVQFKQMSHAEIARHERKARKHLHNPLD